MSGFPAEDGSPESGLCSLGCNAGVNAQPERLNYFSPRSGKSN